MPDREKVLNDLRNARTLINDGYNERGTTLTGDRCKYCVNAIDAAIIKLKEQEAVEPYIDIDEAKCPICKVKLTRQELLGDDVLFEDFFDYCPHCGKPVKWE